MKIITIIVLITLLATKIEAQKVPNLTRDTLGWLKTHIENRSTNLFP